MPITPAQRPPGPLSFKAVEATPERPNGAGSRVMSFVVTTDALDRDGEVVIPSGLRTDEYLKNPQFLWAHQYAEPPIGRCLGLQLSQGGRALVGRFEFNKLKRSDEIFSLYRDGYLKCVSIGFRALVAGPPTAQMLMARPELTKCLRVITAGKLFEVSAVPIPSNPEASLAIQSKALRLSPELAAMLVPQVLPAMRTVEAAVADQIMKDLPLAIASAATQALVGLAVTEGVNRLLRGPKP